MTSGPSGAFFKKLALPTANPIGTPNRARNNTFNTSTFYGFNEDQNRISLTNLAAELGNFAVPDTGSLLLGTVATNHDVFFYPANVTLESADTISTSNTNQLSRDFSASDSGDNIRVLTEYSPSTVLNSASAAALLGLSLITLVSIRRRMA